MSWCTRWLRDSSCPFGPNPSWRRSTSSILCSLGASSNGWSGVAAQVAYRSPFWRTWTMDGHCGRKTHQEAPAPGWQFLAVVAGHSLEDEKAFRWVDGYDHIMTSCVFQTDIPHILEDAFMAIQQWPNEHAKLHQQQVRCYLIIMISSLSHR